MIPNQKLGQVLDIAEDIGRELKPLMNITPREEKIIDVEPESTPGNIDDDFDYARKQLKNVIDTGNQNMQELMQLAAMTQEPKIYEQITKMMKEIVTANEKLIQLYKTRKDATSKFPTPENGSVQNITNQTLLVGSTKEVLEMIGNKKKDTSEDIKV